MVDVFKCECGKMTRRASELNDVMKELLCPHCNTTMKGEILVIQTKLESYESLDEDKLGESRKKIYETIMLEEGTDSELTKRLGFSDPNKVRPRRFELVNMGLIKASHKRSCAVTHKTCTVWVIA